MKRAPILAAMLVAGLVAGPVGGVAAAPSSAAPATAIHEASPAAPRAPGDLGWNSSNWAGYAVTGGPYSSVSGKWTVPKVSASRRAGFSALWVGVDGFSSRGLIQAGTEADFYGGAGHYSAWWEILPAPAVAIRTLSVRPGDRISVMLSRLSAGRWRITVSDARSGSYVTTRSYDGPATSAEWIEEAPLVRGRITPLAVHGTVVFHDVTLNGRSPGLVPLDGGAMIRRGVLVDTPSAPGAAGNSFALAQQAVPPAAPAASGRP